MKMKVTLIVTLAAFFVAVGSGLADDQTGKKAGADNDENRAGLITEPSGAEPSNDPNGYKPIPIDGQTNANVSSTITISHTISNAPNTITIVGMVDSEQEKQAAEAKLQEALPGKTINNFLVVSNQSPAVSEPAGAERNSRKSDELQNGDVNQSK